MHRWLLSALLQLAASRRVLVTTFGGSGATGVMGALRAAGFATNSISDGDRLKFMPLTRMGRELTAKKGLMCEKKRGDKCFDRVFVVLRDDPVRALASIIGSRRTSSVRSGLKRGCRRCPHQFAGAPKDVLRKVFRHARQTNSDGFGMDNFVESWLKVAESHELMSSSTRYPPIMFVDANTLASPDFQCFLYAYLELGDLDTQTRLSRALAAPQTMHHRPNATALMDAASTQVYDELKMKVKRALDHSHEAAVKTFWNVTRLCRHRDLSSPLATAASQPPAVALRRPSKREMREIREVRGERVKGPKPIDPITLIPDELWDATLFAILDQTAKALRNA